jgi:hypothetical protein
MSLVRRGGMIAGIVVGVLIFISVAGAARPPSVLAYDGGVDGGWVAICIFSVANPDNATALVLTGGLVFWMWRKRRSRHPTHMELAARPFSDTSSMSTDTYRSKGSLAVRLPIEGRGKHPGQGRPRVWPGRVEVRSGLGVCSLSKVRAASWVWSHG